MLIVSYSNGVQYALNGWYILDGHKAPAFVRYAHNARGYFGYWIYKCKCENYKNVKIVEN